MLEKAKASYNTFLQERINQRNRRHLINQSPVIIANDCTGGFLYKFLGLKYTTPFMWISFPSDGFVSSLERFDEFMNTPLIEDKKKSEESGYPVLRGLDGVIMNFPHSKSFHAASEKWEMRKSRLERILLANGQYHYPTEHIGFMITEGYTDRDVLLRFAALPFAHKIAFISDPENSDIPDTFYIRDWEKSVGLYSTQNRLTRSRYIDQFDYVGFMNSLL